MENLALAYRLCIARFIEKSNSAYRIVKFASQQEEKSWFFNASKHANGFHRTLKFSALNTAFLNRAIGWVSVCEKHVLQF